MSIHQLKDGRWVVNVKNPDGSGKWKQEYCGRGLEGQKEAQLIESISKTLHLSRKRAPKQSSLTEAEACKNLISQLEKYYKIEEIEIEFNTKIGRVDILTPDEIIEVKNVNGWKSGIGQLLAYNHYIENHHLRLHLFGNTTIKQLKKIISVCADFDISITHDQGNRCMINRTKRKQYSRRERDYGVEYLRKKMRILRSSGA